MTLFEILQAPGMLPFEIAFGVVVALLLLELILSQFGVSGAAGDGDADLDLDVDGGLDADLDVDADFDLSVDGVDGVDGFDADAVDLEVDSPTSGGAAGGALGWLGLGAVPSMIWLAILLTVFALLGYGLQLTTGRLFGALLSGSIASLIAAPPAIFVGGRLSRWLGRLIPKETSTAISTRSYGRRRGVVTVGTARDGLPAQVRFTDSHGNMHYAMATPLDPRDEFPQGTEVLLVRIREGELKAVAISN